jgi:hypothetical protein
VTLGALIKGEQLLVRSSAQKAELITLMQVLQLAAGVWTLNMTLLPFMSMEPHIKKGGSLTQEEKNVKYGQEILELLEALWAPK